MDSYLTQVINQTRFSYLYRITTNTSATVYNAAIIIRVHSQRRADEDITMSRFGYVLLRIMWIWNVISLSIHL